MNSAKKIKNFIIKRLYAYINTINADTMVSFKFFSRNSARVDLYGYFSVMKKIEQPVCILNNMFYIFCFENRRCTPSEIQGIAY